MAPANTAAVSGQAISSTAFNTLETDVGTEITNSVDRLGRSAMQAALPMGANKITGMADPSVATDAATKNYVDTATAAFFSTGDVKLTLKTVADSGWLLFDDTTFGSATSGASNQSVNNQALFTLFFNNLADASAPLLTSGGAGTTRAGQVSASAAWAANCRMSLPKTLGRALAIAGSGSGLTSRLLGQSLGEEAHVLTGSELPAVAPTFTGTPTTYSSNESNVPVNETNLSFNLSTSSPNATIPANGNISSKINTVVTPAGTISALGSGASHNNMQPTVFLNAMVKQ